MATPSDENVTTFVPTASIAVKVTVITSLTIASVSVELFEAMPTSLSVGKVLSKVTLLEFVTAVTSVPAFPEISLKATVKLTAPSVSSGAATYWAVQFILSSLTFV